MRDLSDVHTGLAGILTVLNTPFRDDDQIDIDGLRRNVRRAVGQMIEALDRGVHSFMPTGMHEIYCEIYRRYQSGRRDEAVSLFRAVLPVLAFSNQHLDVSIHFFKRLLWREGLYATPRVRDPILPFDTIHQSTADELIQLVFEITASIQP